MARSNALERAKYCYNTIMITYYTDGSASPNPGPGGFAVIRDGRPYLIGGESNDSPVNRDQTTNIRMEATAILTAIHDANGQPCQITTDSEFWINVLTKWAPGWAKNGWRKKSGEIKNLDLVKQLYDLYDPTTIKLVWTRGHAGTELNELADQWANHAREMKLTNPILVDQL